MMVDISTPTGVLSCKEAEQGKAAQIRLFKALLHDIAINREVKNGRTTIKSSTHTPYHKG
jgi:hypothetical protein